MKNLHKILAPLEGSSPKEIMESINDIYSIYLDTDIAGDNQDRKRKYNAMLMFNNVFKEIHQCIESQNNNKKLSV